MPSVGHIKEFTRSYAAFSWAVVFDFPLILYCLLTSFDIHLQMAQSASPINLQAWDDELALTNADYEKLYQEMLKANKESSVETVDILWRLAKVTYLVGFNLLDQKAIKEKTQEVVGYAEKALNQDESHFQANLWLASALGKLALMESDLQLKLKPFTAFLKHLSVCVKLNAQDHLVLYMEGRLHLALMLQNAEEKAAVEQHLNAHNLPVPVFDFATAESKLRKSLELNPNLLDSYITLAYLLYKSSKFAEACEVIDKALTVPRFTKWDEILAKDMEQLKAHILKVHLPSQ